MENKLIPMMLTKKSIAAMFLIFCGMGVMGQDEGNADKAENERQRYLNIGPGFSYQKVKDLGMSRMMYRGPAFTGYTGYHFHTEKFRSDLDVYLFAGEARAASGAAAGLYKAELNYAYLRKLNFSFHDVKWLAGGAVTNAGSVRQRYGYSNNAFGFDYFAAIHLVASAWRDLDVKGRHLEIGWGLSVPVVALALRPAYVFPGPPEFYDMELDYVRSTLKSFNTVSWGKYFKVQSSLTANYFLQNGNALSLTYRWEYYNYDAIPENELWAASHSFIFATKFKL